MRINQHRPQLRIIGWSAMAPDRAVCTLCDRVFTLLDGPHTSVEKARDVLEREFLAHRCPGPRPLPRFACS